MHRVGIARGESALRPTLGDELRWIPNEAALVERVRFAPPANSG